MVRTLAFAFLLAVGGCSSASSSEPEFDQPAAVAQAKILCARAAPFLPVPYGLSSEALVTVGYLQSFCRPLLGEQVPATFDGSSVEWLQALLATLSQASPETKRWRF